jgi:hypothetical protein
MCAAHQPPEPQVVERIANNGVARLRRVALPQKRRRKALDLTLAALARALPCAVQTIRA